MAGFDTMMSDGRTPFQKPASPLSAITSLAAAASPTAFSPPGAAGPPSRPAAGASAPGARARRRAAALLRLTCSCTCIRVTRSQIGLVSSTFTEPASAATSRYAPAPARTFLLASAPSTRLLKSA